jgi:hypothetical protein
MNMTQLNNEIRELHIDELDKISSGMTCESALGVSSVYRLTGDILLLLGNAQGATGFYGLAQGVEQGGCGK